VSNSIHTTSTVLLRHRPRSIPRRLLLRQRVGYRPGQVAAAIRPDHDAADVARDERIEPFNRVQVPAPRFLAVSGFWLPRFLRGWAARSPLALVCCRTARNGLGPSWTPGRACGVGWWGSSKGTPPSRNRHRYREAGMGLYGGCHPRRAAQSPSLLGESTTPHGATDAPPRSRDHGGHGGSRPFAPVLGGELAHGPTWSPLGAGPPPGAVHFARWSRQARSLVLGGWWRLGGPRLSIRTTGRTRLPSGAPVPPNGPQLDPSRSRSPISG
jgi:hypothetical protein